MAEQDVPTHLPSSTYVTRLAWILLVAAGIALPVSIYQNVRLHTVFFAEKAAATSQLPPGASTLVRLLSHIELIYPVLMFVSAYTLVSAIGLLLRKNWARRLLIAILALGIAGCAAAIAIAVALLLSGPTPSVPRRPSGQHVMMTATYLLSIPVSFWGGIWLVRGIVKLTSKEIRAEFGPTFPGPHPHL
jgi:hypothetical protein